MKMICLQLSDWPGERVTIPVENIAYLESRGPNSSVVLKANLTRSNRDGVIAVKESLDEIHTFIIRA